MIPPRIGPVVAQDSRRRLYSRSPIVEAIIDFRVEPDGETNSETLRRMRPAEYPTVLDAHEIVQQFSADGSEDKTTRTLVGFVLRSTDEKQVVQAQVKGFTFSRLAPYESWEPFVAECHRLWGTYREIARPMGVSRLAVRYINRLKLTKSVTLTDFLRTSPDTPDEIGRESVDFFMRLRSAFSDIGAILTLNELSEPQAEPAGELSIILDMEMASPAPSDEDELWNQIQRLHEKVEMVFEASLTEKMKELIR
jgi:uncharacterized protein (TIGR04255 family)